MMKSPIQPLSKRTINCAQRTAKPGPFPFTEMWYVCIGVLKESDQHQKRIRYHIRHQIEFENQRESISVNEIAKRQTSSTERSITQKMLNLSLGKKNDAYGLKWLFALLRYFFGPHALKHK